jgi:hypothetical protein
VKDLKSPKRKLGNVMEMDQRTAYVLASAIAFTVDAISSLPAEYRPESNLADMKSLLASFPREAREFAEMDVAVWLTHFRTC